LRYKCKDCSKHHMKSRGLRIRKMEILAWSEVDYQFLIPGVHFYLYNVKNAGPNALYFQHQH